MYSFSSPLAYNIYTHIHIDTHCSPDFQCKCWDCPVWFEFLWTERGECSLLRWLLRWCCSSSSHKVWQRCAEPKLVKSTTLGQAVQKEWYKVLSYIQHCVVDLYDQSFSSYILRITFRPHLQQYISNCAVFTFSTQQTGYWKTEWTHNACMHAQSIEQQDLRSHFQPESLSQAYN